MSNLDNLTDTKILELLQAGTLKHYTLEQHLDPLRAVKIRQQYLLPEHSAAVRDSIPCEGYLHYDVATKSCCEGVIGFLPLPLGLAGPLLLNSKEFRVPIATTEGALVASLTRGCRAVSQRCEYPEPWFRFFYLMSFLLCIQSNNLKILKLQNLHLFPIITL